MSANRGGTTVLTTAPVLKMTILRRGLFCFYYRAEEIITCIGHKKSQMT